MTRRISTISFVPIIFAVAAAAQVPTISNITTSTDTNVVMIAYNVSPATTTYCWVRYGVSSGTYLWSSRTIYSGANGNPSGVCSIPIDALADGTTYYFLPTARPDPDDETNICALSGCGAVEQTATTPAASVSHLPAPPVSVASNLLAQPDITAFGGYAIINLTPTGAGGECVSSTTVSAPSGYTGTIPANTTLTTILGTSSMQWYGTVFQVPAGSTCIVKEFAGQVTGMGYNLQPMPVDPLASSIDDLAHRWMIWRTTPTTPTNLPPFGVRTTPALFATYGGFESNTPNTSGNDTLDGFIFECVNATGSYPVHHHWIENLKFSVDNTLTTSRWGVFFQMGNGEGGGTPPFPKYIVFRGNYIHGPERPNLNTGYPYARGTIIGTMQGQIAIVGNYIDNAYTYASGGLWTNFYFLDCGGSNNCSTGGPVLIDNNYIHGMDMMTIIESNNPINTTAPHDFSVTRNSSYWPPATLAYAQFLGGGGCRQHIEFKFGQRVLVSGNFINGTWACSDTGDTFQILGSGFTSDFKVSSNYITNSASVFTSAGQATLQAPYSLSSSGNRLLISNNLAYNLGRATRNANGGGAGTQFMSSGTGFTNMSLVGNTIVGPLVSAGTYIPWIFQSSGIGNGSLAGFVFQNNIVPFEVSGGANQAFTYFQNGLTGNGILSHPYTPMGMDSGIQNPTNYAYVLGTNAGHADGAAGLGMQGASVIGGGTGYPNNGNLIFANCSIPPVGTFTASGGVINQVVFTVFGICNPMTMSAAADNSGGGSGASFRPHYGLTPSYSWGGNAIVPLDYQGQEMSDVDAASLNPTMPQGDYYPNAAIIQSSCASTRATGCMTAHLQAAGLTGVTNNDFRCTSTMQSSCSAGANINKLQSDLGIVSDVRTQLGVTNAAVSYLAPDSRACSVDISPDGVTWTRNSDLGGFRYRWVPFTGLTPSTPYLYRVLCYFDQSEGASSGWFSFPSNPSNLATDGTFTTLTADTQNPAFGFSLAPFPSATSVTISATGISGAVYSNTCTTSPCVLSNVPVGDYKVVKSFFGGGRTWTSDAQIVAVR